MTEKKKYPDKTRNKRGKKWRSRASLHREAVILYASMFLACKDLIPDEVKDLLQKHWTPEIREAVNYLDDPKQKGQTSTRATLPKFVEAVKKAQLQEVVI
ncbi:MAG: hypothetical protein ACXAC2_00490 [Candidatus Kariarchaeaceae archaeon]|jgi:hypothetical protein